MCKTSATAAKYGEVVGARRWAKMGVGGPTYLPEVLLAIVKTVGRERRVARRPIGSRSFHTPRSTCIT
jgi:hypothetical protein